MKKKCSGRIWPVMSLLGLNCKFYWNVQTVRDVQIREGEREGETDKQTGIDSEKKRDKGLASEGGGEAERGTWEIRVRWRGWVRTKEVHVAEGNRW